MRKMRPRRAALSAVVVSMSLGIALAGCSGGSPAVAPPSSEISTLPAPAVTDEALGAALSKLAFQGAQIRSSDGGACFVAAVRKAGLSGTAGGFIVGSASDDLGAVAGGLDQISKNDAGIMLSAGLRQDFDACVDSQLLPKRGGESQTYVPLKAAGEPAKTKPNLKPRYPLPGTVRITSATRLKDGVVSTFSSYALNDKQKHVYEVAGECLARVIFDAGFSQKTLILLAGGPPIGAGSIADHLPTTADKQLWVSPKFLIQITDCVDNASPR